MPDVSKSHSDLRDPLDDLVAGQTNTYCAATQISVLIKHFNRLTCDYESWIDPALSFRSIWNIVGVKCIPNRAAVSIELFRIVRISDGFEPKRATSSAYVMLARAPHIRSFSGKLNRKGEKEQQPLPDMVNCGEHYPYAQKCSREFAFSASWKDSLKGTPLNATLSKTVLNSGKITIEGCKKSVKLHKLTKVKNVVNVFPFRTKPRLIFTYLSLTVIDQSA